MDIKKLPVVSPKFSTYNYFGAAGIVAQQNKYCSNWYYNNCVQLQCALFNLDNQLNLTLNVDFISSIPFFKRQYKRKSYIINHLFDYIKECILDDYYLYFTYVDDYFIENKSYYNKSHFHHDGLITGFDNEHHTYTIAAHDENFVFRTFECSQLSFAEGYNYGYRMSYETGLIPDIVALKPDVTFHGQEIMLDLSKIKHELYCYLLPDENTEFYRGTNTAFGVNTYNEIEKYLNYINNTNMNIDYIDKRIFKMLFEHKQNIYDMILTLEYKQIIKMNLSETYKTVLHYSNICHNLYAKAIKSERIKEIRYIGEYLEKIKAIEISTLNSLYTLL